MTTFVCDPADVGITSCEDTNYLQGELKKDDKESLTNRILSVYLFCVDHGVNYRINSEVNALHNEERNIQTIKVFDIISFCHNNNNNNSYRIQTVFTSKIRITSKKERKL